MNTNSQPIFILDDEEIFSFSIEHYLQKAGYTNIHRFETSEQLFANMDKNPEVLILDHFLQNEIGLDVMEEVKKTHPSTKVIYLSAQKTASIAVRALKLGAFAYQEKSITDIQKIIELIQAEENVEFTAVSH
ncbi:MAG: response regulator [Crocinitomicaceae bacterium]|nr:response regulator [Crocinitomicaceae bacterium]